MPEKSVAGQPLVRLDARSKAAGQYRYGMDWSLPGMLHGVILRSAHPHAKILNIDVSEAKRLSGVAVALTGSDLPEILMPGMVSDQPPLARDRVRYAGEPLALVAADSLATAQEAAGLIEVAYEPLPIVDDAEQAMLPGATLVHEGWQEYEAAEGLVREGNVCCHSTLTRGDIEGGFAEADEIFEGTYSTESVHQSHLEPRVAIGAVDSDGRIAVYTNTQLPYWIRTNVAHVLGVDEAEVRIVPTGIGGGFGSKLYPQLEPLAALLARETGRPVRMVTPIEEEMIGGLPRHPCRLHLKTGVKKDGTLVAREARMILDTGAYAGSGPELASVGVLVLSGPYKTPHLKLDAFAVMTNKTNFGAYRGPSGPQAVFALESHMDEVAEGLGMDPLEFRLKNVVEEGDEAGNGQVLSGVGMKEALEKASAAIGWGEPSPPNRGKGLACGWWTTTGGSSGCLAKLDVGGKVVLTVGTQEIGTGAIMAGVPQVVAEEMGLRLEDLRVEVADTATGPWDFGSQGSRTLFNVGRAAQFAAQDLIVQIKELAGEEMEVAVEDIELREGAAVVKGVPDRRISLADLAQQSLNERGGLHSRGVSNPEPAKYDNSRMISCFYPAFHYPSFFCHAAEVEVDPGTGIVRVVRYAAAHDVGFAVNPKLAQGQIHGGVVQGVGMALMEGIIYEDGQVVNNNWTDYKLPTIADVPEVEAIIVEHPVEGGPFGAKGLGEPPVIPPPAALANAIYRAVRVRLRSLPMTPERVFLALRDAN
ncbi:MAG: xanthine dehydrogenase family protein molybdopterin-binding subunit [Anaerolineae bacterium]|nr:MAG: xanthine dehydrogenase family protein molybdopterin-binding subunit [Anaerolineae bacterium]